MVENIEEKRKSRISSLIKNSNIPQYIIHYSENNWETCEEIHLFLDDEATIGELLNESIQKFKTELYYDDIDKKKFNVRIFKKKKKIPNNEYPICNIDSKVKDFDKTHFCLVEKKERENSNEEQKDDINENIQINEEKEKRTTNDNEIKNDNNYINNINYTNKNQINNNSNNNNNIGETKDEKEIEKNNERINKQNCRPCLIF